MLAYRSSADALSSSRIRLRKALILRSRLRDQIVGGNQDPVRSVQLQAGRFSSTISESSIASTTNVDGAPSISACSSLIRESSRCELGHMLTPLVIDEITAEASLADVVDVGSGLTFPQQEMHSLHQAESHRHAESRQQGCSSLHEIVRISERVTRRTTPGLHDP